MQYQEFIEQKSNLNSSFGFDPVYHNDMLFDFQRFLVDWAVRQGRASIFADCGTGKTPMQLTWAQNVHKKTGKPVIVMTPLAVSYQTAREAQKFGIDAAVSREGKVTAAITITNYERLHHFDRDDFGGAVLDESSAIKHFTGKRQKGITRFMSKFPYRLLCTATAAPNDYIELGTASEALGHLGYMDMLSMFFVSDDNRFHATWGFSPKWRFKKHAELHFWRWVSSWARAMRKPSDYGFDDSMFVLPPLTIKETAVDTDFKREGELFHYPAKGLSEERAERRGTINERCAAVADMVSTHDDPAVCWCHLNDEADTLVKMIPDAEQVSGSDKEEDKESKLLAFARGDLRVLVTKPKIAGFGLNWQHCSHMTMFPSHSYEQYYQSVRRCWRFGQKNPVKVDIITTSGESRVVANMRRKEEAADKMFSVLVQEMNNAIKIDRLKIAGKKMEVPSWQ